MKKFYLVLCAALFAVATFAVEYQAPITVWEGTSSPLYGYDNHMIITQDTYDWSQVVENTRITILFKDALTESRYRKKIVKHLQMMRQEAIALHLMMWLCMIWRLAIRSFKWYCPAMVLPHCSWFLRCLRG